MDVPKRLMELAGVTSWRKSLGTTDERLAAIKRANLTAHYKGEIIRLDGMLTGKVAQDARDLVDRAFEVWAARKGSLDPVVRAMLTFITLRVRQSWSRLHEIEANWDFGLVFCGVDEDEEGDADFDVPEPLPGFDSDEERDGFMLRQRLIERRGMADGITHQEVARRLLERQGWVHVECELLALLDVVGTELKPDMPQYRPAAEHFLRRLAEHTFSDWQPGFREALGSLAVMPAPLATQSPLAAQSPSPAPPPPSWMNAGPRTQPTQTLSAGLAKWIKSMKPGGSAITEATRAVDRFIELCGDMHVASITENDVFDYRDFISSMPKGLSLPAIKNSGKTLRGAVDAAHIQEHEEQRRALAAGLTAPKPSRLSPTSVKKDIGGLSAIFAALRSERWILKNPAEKIPVEGYSKDKKVFPFRPDMMRQLFDSPMFTGCQGIRGKKRTITGPYVFQDTLYWSFLFGATVGHRMSEVASALTDNVEETIGPKGEKIVGIFITDAKNEHSQRVIIVHPQLLALGFLDHVNERRRQGKTYLFDLPGGGAKKLSERLNGYIDAVLVNDRRYVFHSLRHEFADRSEIDVGVDLSKKIMGHARGRLYGLGAPLHHAANELNKIDMSFVDWDRLISATNSG